MKPAKFDTFPRPAFRVYRTAHGVAVERVTVHGVDRLSGSAQCSLAAPGYGLKNAVGFAELASSERRAVALAARLLLPAAAVPVPFAERCAAVRERKTAAILSVGRKPFETPKNNEPRSWESPRGGAVPLHQIA